MQFIESVYLQLQEVTIIRKSITVEIGGYKNILDGETETDMVMYCLENELVPSIVQDYLWCKLEYWQQIYIKPDKVFNLTPLDKSHFITQLINLELPNHQEKYRKSLLLKFSTIENLSIYFNPN